MLSQHSFFLFKRFGRRIDMALDIHEQFIHIPVMPLFPSGTGMSIERLDSDDMRVDREPLHEEAEIQSPSSRIRIKNRRKRYLDLHPEYFTSSHLELADPLLYDRLIRRFQNPSEREAEGRRKGYSGRLEADLLRSEAKIEALVHPDPNQSFAYRRGADGEILAEEKDEVPRDKEHGYQTWKWEMEMRFIRGADQEFDYDSVDERDEFDDRTVEEREVEEEWFNQEEARFVDEGDAENSPKSGELQGETGIQDF